MRNKITLEDLQNKKKNKQKITVLTAYDFPMAKLVDQAQMDVVLVGDSLANVVLGLDSTTQVGMFEMLHHTKAVRRGVEYAYLVGDMPYESYQVHTDEAVVNAKRFVDEAGCDAVKVEWFDKCLEVTEAIVRAGIPVMGHVGLTPQTADKLGGFKVQGKDVKSAQEIIDRAVALEKQGCFSIVLECIPSELAKKITEKLTIPTIGIGAGVDCDGQVLVVNDLLGLFDRYKPKFVKQYVNLNQLALSALEQYRQEVKDRQFPDDNHSFGMKLDEK